MTRWVEAFRKAQVAYHGHSHEDHVCLYCKTFGHSSDKQRSNEPRNKRPVCFIPIAWVFTRAVLYCFSNQAQSCCLGIFIPLCPPESCCFFAPSRHKKKSSTCRVFQPPSQHSRRQALPPRNDCSKKSMIRWELVPWRCTSQSTTSPGALEASCLYSYIYRHSALRTLRLWQWVS